MLKILKMSNTSPIIYILCIVSVLAILYLVALFSSIIDKKDLGVSELFKAWHNDDKAEQWRIKRDRYYLWLYAIIPLLLFMALVLIMQLNIGNLKSRLDVTFIASSAFWLCLALFIHKLIKKNKI